MKFLSYVQLLELFEYILGQFVTIPRILPSYSFIERNFKKNVILTFLRIIKRTSKNRHDTLRYEKFYSRKTSIPLVFPILLTSNFLMMPVK